MSRTVRYAVLGTLLVLTLPGCSGEPNPFTVTIHNDGSSTLLFRGDTQPEPDVYVEWGGEWEITGGAGEEGCYDPCSKPFSSVCLTILPDYSTYALLPGDSANYDSPGEAFQPRTDGTGGCRGNAPLAGPVLVELCYGDDAGSLAAEPTGSGGVGDAYFDIVDCATVEMDLPDQDEATLTIP